ncbi:MAG: glycosyltransferase family 25 protein [Flavobacteriales bacterium]
MKKLLVDKVFIVHVRENNTVRREFITNQMESHGIEFEFMLHGDIVDLNEDNMKEYFLPELISEHPAPRESCSFKHLYIYKEIVNRGVKSVLIFEDDIFLDDKFVEIFNATMKEVQERTDIESDRLFISYENSLLEFVSKKDLTEGQYLYKSNNTRCAGAYFITHSVAQKILNYTLENKLGVGIDWQHKKMLNEGIIDVYWCHPAIAEQGSHNGRLASLLDDKKSGFLRQLSWKIQRFYKKNIRGLFK